MRRKPSKLHHGGVVNVQAEVVLDGVLQQLRAAAGIICDLAVHVGGVDALHFPFGDVHPQVARDGDERNLVIFWAQDRDDHGVGAIRGAGTFVRADQQEGDHVRAFVDDRGRRDERWDTAHPCRAWAGVCRARRPLSAEPAEAGAWRMSPQRWWGRAWRARVGMAWGWRMTFLRG